jgi:hypothetical protein
VLPGQATGYTAHRKFSRGGFQLLHTVTFGGLEQALFLAERACWTRPAVGGHSSKRIKPGDADGAFEPRLNGRRTLSPTWTTLGALPLMSGTSRSALATPHHRVKADVLVLPARERCRAYRWPRDAREATIFVAAYPTGPNSPTAEHAR